MPARRNRRPPVPASGSGSGILQESAKPAPLVLVVSRDPALRRLVAASLAPDFAATGMEPSALAAPAHFVDAAAAVACLGPDDDGESVAALLPLLSLPLRSSLLLSLHGARKEVVAGALAQLEPAQVLTQPVPEALLRYAVSRALGSSTPGRGARSQQRRAPALLGVSTAIREVLDQVRQVAPSPVAVLIQGETGTGKELVARAIHEQSPRAGGPFVAINCGALPDSLLESELFGHRRGAFTGAARDKIGLFEVADGGTQFLDEVGDTSPALQMKLLRAIESHEVRPLGDTESRQVDVRLISATHRDLDAAIEEGAFRQDLLYRLNVVTLYVPPLRRRRVDIPFLAQHFAEELGAAQARRITLDEDFLEALSSRDFPGNVRELRNAVERAITLAAEGEPVSARDLPPATACASPEPRPFGGTLRERIERVEAEAIREALEHCQGNRRKMAEALGLSRPGLRYKMRRLGLDTPDEK
jgi:DNA-binding NtrC family response regulator